MNREGGAGFAGDANADLRNGRIVFDYAGGASPAATVRSLLAASYGAGFASGLIHSSTATASTALGWIDDPAARQVTVARALYGDANLDGTVDVEDFNRVLLNHDPSRAVWSWGDFNYDGQVNSVDLSMMLANYGQTLLPLGGGLLLSVDNIWVGESGGSWNIHMNWSLEHYPTGGENAVFPYNVEAGWVYVNLDADVDTVVFHGDYTLYSYYPYYSTLTFNGMYVGTDKEVVISDVDLIGEGDIYSSGFLTFTGDSTYSGDTYVMEGELRVTSSIADSEVTVDDATLSGTGTTGDVTVIDNGVLSPGGFGTGILYTRNLTFGPSYSGPHFEVDVWSDEDYDQVYVEGTVDLFGDPILDVVSNLQVAGDEVLVLIKNDGYDSITGTFFELEEGDMVLVGDVTYMITYRYNAEAWEPDTGNDVGLVPLPANMTAYRPAHNPAGSPNGVYAPFAQTAVDEADEESATLGPGIRINGDTEIPANENDLIEVLLFRTSTNTNFRLWRSNENIKVWTTSSMDTEITFSYAGGLETAELLTWGEYMGHMKTVWVEWDGAGHGTADLSLKENGVGVRDTVKFHTFHSIAVFLGGKDQVPSDPPSEPNNFGTFVVAIDLYKAGWDVWMYNESAVAGDGKGEPFNEVVNAYANRGVTDVAVHGYSKGGGATYDLVYALIYSKGIYADYSGYVDAVSSTTGYFSEERRPELSLYHLNIYQTSGAFDGVPTKPKYSQDDEYPADGWTPGVDHYTIDDHAQTKSLIKTKMAAKLQNR